MRRLVAPLLVLCTAAPGCHRGGKAPSAPATAADERFTGSLSAPPSAGSEVVAEVNGDPIYADDVRVQAAGRDISAHQALDELIAVQLLAQEAQRRGLADAPEIVEVRRRERVRRLIDTVFLPTMDGPDKVPEALVERAWQTPEIRSYYDHDVGHRCAFVRVIAPAKATPDVDGAARAAAQQLLAVAQAAHPATGESFLALMASTAQARGFKIEKSTFVAVDNAANVDPAFTAAAFSLHARGDISALTRTPWGWDILFLDEILPARHVPREVDAVEIREHLFPDAQKDAFLAWLSSLPAAQRVQLQPSVSALLEQIAVDSPVGLP